jgi:tetratricopeptide (TPR) repeat protein
MSNRANAMMMMRTNYPEVERLYHRALAIEEGAFGPDSPQAATYANNIVNLLVDEGRFADAEPYARRAVDIRTRKLGDHPLTARAVINLARIVAQLGKGDEAEALFARGFAIQARVLTPGVYDFAYAHELHGTALLELGHPAAASAELADAYARMLKLRGEASGDATEALAKWARAEALAGDGKSALAHADQALGWAIKADDRYYEAFSRWSRAEALAVLGRSTEAADDAKRGIAKLADDRDNADAPRLSAQLATWLAAHPARR